MPSIVAAAVENVEFGSFGEDIVFNVCLAL